MTSSAAKKGFLATAMAFVLWGQFPIYWKSLLGIPAPEILGYRILWSALFLVLVLWKGGSWPQVRQALGNGPLRTMLSASGALLGANWLIYIWAVNSGHVLESSLGYFITPLFNVLWGFLFFRDRLRRLQWVAIALAAGGVLFVLVRYGEIPWIALGLAVTFSVYGLLRKMAQIDAAPGLFIETAVMAPFALCYLIYLWRTGTAAYPTEYALQNTLLALIGVVTTVPLMLFAFGARRISLVTVGFLQYLSPTGQFLLGLLLYGEPFTSSQAVAFGCIWAALAIYSLEGVYAWRRTPELISTSGK